MNDLLTWGRWGTATIYGLMLAWGGSGADEELQDFIWTGFFFLFIVVMFLDQKIEALAKKIDALAEGQEQRQCLACRWWFSKDPIAQDLAIVPDEKGRFLDEQPAVRGCPTCSARRHGTEDS